MPLEDLKEKSLVLIDGNSLMFRAYYATAYTGNLMQTSTGLYTNALYGFVNMINKVLSIMPPYAIVVAFDKGKKTFRHEAFHEYKGTRKQMPEELGLQIDLIKEYLDVLGIKRLELDDYEADDIVGSFAKMGSQKEMKVSVFSGDKDLLQLVDHNVIVYLTKKGVTELDEYNLENFNEKMGFNPAQLTDYKAMIGDASDNLAGIRGIGPKTAVSLLNKYASIESIIENAPNIKGKTGEMIREDAEVAKKTKYLATIYKDIELPYNIDDIKMPVIDEYKLRLFYEKVEFTSFIKKMKMSTLNKNEETPIIHEYMGNDLDSLIKEINENKESVLYVETELTASNYHKADLLGVGIVVKNKGYFFNKLELFNEKIVNLLESETLIKRTIDLKKVLVSLKKEGIDLKGYDFDLLLASYIIDPSSTVGDIKAIMERYSSNTLPYLDEIYGKKDIYNVPDSKTYEKYCLDKLFVFKDIYNELYEKLKDADQLAILENMELPLSKVLARVEMNGFKIDQKRLTEIGEMLKHNLEELEEKIYEVSGEKFNIASPKQLGIILFEKLNLMKGKKNKTGYSTSAEELQKMAEIHPLPGLVLEYRKNAKLYSTYVQGLFTEINGVDGKVHTIFKQTLTQTGRLSSVEPNIQNIPVRTEEGKIIRSAFVSSFKDGLIISCDYSQIELRVLAKLANCKRMLESFNNNEDLHTATAAKIYNIKASEVTKEQRRFAKTVNFGIVYGMSDWGLAESLHISPIEAGNFIEKYFEIYPEIKTYLDEQVQNAYEKGYSITMFNRRRYINELQSSNKTLRKFGERTAMNAPIQGSAADIIKLAMIKVEEKLEKELLQSKMVAQVHDELVFDVVNGEAEIIKTIVKETMENILKGEINLTAELSVGKTWDLK